MNKVSYYTEEGLENFRKELDFLKNKERRRISQAIADARDKGDLSENAEYDAAKEAQGHLEARIAKMEATLATARIIDDSQLDNDQVRILSLVEVLNKSTNTKMKYVLVAPSEVSLQEGKISIESPIGKSLLGKKVGEIAKTKVPNGFIELEILKISRG